LFLSLRRYTSEQERVSRLLSEYRVLRREGSRWGKGAACTGETSHPPPSHV